MSKIFISLIFLLGNIVLSNTGDYYFDIGVESKTNLNKAKENFTLAIKYYEEDDNFIGLSKSYYYLGLISRMNGNNIDAILNYSISINYSEDLDKIITLNTISNMVSVLLDLNLYTEAELYHNKGLNIINESSEDLGELTQRTYYNYANYLFYMKMYTECRNYLDNINIEQIKYKYQIFNLYGLLFQQTGDLKKSKDYFLKAIENKPGYNVALINLVRYYGRSGDKDSLDKYIKLYYNSNQSKSSLLTNVDTLIFSEIDYIQGKYNKSIVKAYNALDYFISNNNYNRGIEAYNLILKSYIALEEFDKTDNIMDSLSILNDKLLKTNLASISEIIKELDKLTYDNQILKKEYAETKNYLMLSVLILVIFIGLTYTSIRFYHLRKDNFRLIFDMVIHINTINATIKNRFRNLMSYNQKILLTQYDLDDDEELFRNHDNIAKVMLDLEDIVDKSSKELKENKKSKKIVEDILNN